VCGKESELIPRWY